MTISVWFDGDETLWDRRGYMLSSLLESDLQGETRGGTRTPALFTDVLPTMVELSENGTINLIDYAPMPAGHDDVLPPFAARVDGPQAPSDTVPELHGTESNLNWLETFERMEAVIAASPQPVDDVILISSGVGSFALAAERGWTTVWLNRERVANLSDIMPSAEISSLLDLPEALEAIDEARAIIAAHLGEKPTTTA